MILSPISCSVKMSPCGDEGESDIELKETEAVTGFEPNQRTQADWRTSRRAVGLECATRPADVGQVPVGGAEALAHGTRGRQSERRIEPGQRSRIVSLARGRYAGVNQQHLAELLADREQIPVSRSSLRRILADAGIGSPRPHRRRRRHRLRRERYRQEGMLVQIDGSRHDWLQDRGPRMTLLAGIDDASARRR